MHDGRHGVAYVKNVAVKGATGRKGSLPLSYAPSQGQIAQPHAQSNAYIQQANITTQNRQSQQYLPSNNKMEFNQGHKGTGKIIKSHAKYFS
jgi:hypothetical protein